MVEEDDSFEDYSSSERWADVAPIPQDEGSSHPLASIAYTEEYSTAMSYLRAVMAADERSERALDLTEHIISMNPAHYTVWLYRHEINKSLKRDFVQELQWINSIALENLKNYQIWSHRKNTVLQLGRLPPTEMSFLSRILTRDAKNYHVWSYRQWLVQHFDLFHDPKELEFAASLIRDDVRNNSAWNHRNFVVLSKDEIEPETFEREIQYTKSRIDEAPQNLSAWNYLRGVLKKQGKGLGEVEGFAAKFADVSKPDDVKSSHALDLLAEVWAAAGAVEEAKADAALLLLSDRFDPIRRNYWQYRRSQLGTNRKAAAPVA